MKDPPKRCTIAVTGHFGEDRDVDRMKQWIENNGGTFSNVVDGKVTHLIRSEEDFEKNV